MRSIFLGCALMVLLIGGGSSLQAQAPVEQRYRELKSSYVERLQQHAAQVSSAGRRDAAQQIRSWIEPHTSTRLSFFLPPPKRTAKPVVSTEPDDQLQLLRQDYALQLFDLIEDACRQGNGAAAYPWLFEVLREHPTHEQAKRILMPVLTAKLPVAKVVPGAHPQFKWPRGRHTVIETEHISLETNYSSKESVEIALALERYHTVWQQMFFSVCASPQKLHERMQGRDVEIASPRKFRVVLFRDRDEYLMQLRKITGIDVSSGIYLDEAKFSAFYMSDNPKRSTWFHELTHQFFQEYWDAKPGVAQNENMWQLEAVALFMESWREYEDYITVGGWDAENLQFARFRALGGDYYLPLDRLAELGRNELQQHADIRKIYSEMAGLGQFFLTDNAGEFRAAYLSALYATYKKGSPTELIRQLQPRTYSDMDQRYLRFLHVTDEEIARTPPHAAIPQLSLRGTSVTDRGLAYFGKCTQLEWIDLSTTAITDVGWEAFPVTEKLRQLFLEQTRITNGAAKHIGEFRELRELYLSGTALTDDALVHFSDLKRLKILDISNCAISDKGVEALLKLSSLESLMITGTQISDVGQDRLRKKFPRLKFVE